MESFIKSFFSWVKNSNERISLQRFYLAAALLAFVAGSFVNIFENEFGRMLILVAMISVVIFVVNAVIWALGKSLLENFAKNSTKSSKK